MVVSAAVAAVVKKTMVEIIAEVAVDSNGG
jgi:hypothetical protein